MLNEKQKRFCEEYIKEMNGKQSAITAGYSKNTAESLASRLLRNVNVQKYLQTLRSEQKMESIITANEVLAELAKVGMAKITDVLEFDDSGVTWKSSKEVDATSIAEVTVTPRGKKIKMHNKVSALTTLLEHFKQSANGLNSEETMRLKELAAKQSRENM